MDAFKDLLSSIGNEKFYFGVGGIGDFLLLMSTFYDDIEGNTNVVFVCNNVKTIREISKEFPLVSRWWFYPRSAFYPSQDVWNDIISKNCLGTGVTPKNFDYVGEWIKCGQHKNGVFGYYGVNKNPSWAKPVPIYIDEQPIVCIQPFGGADDPTKIKRIPDEIVQKLISDYESVGFRVFLLGSRQDEHNSPSYTGHHLWQCGSIIDSMGLIEKCDDFHGADSWGKTYAKMCSKRVFVYKNRYENSAMEMFGHERDPGDYVFLDGWGFNLV